MREVEAGDGGDLEGAGLVPAVAVVTGGVAGRDVGPGQGGQDVFQHRLATLDHGKVVGILLGDQPVEVGPHGVHRVERQDLPRQVEAFEQRAERGSLVALAVDAGGVAQPLGDRSHPIMPRRRQRAQPHRRQARQRVDPTPPRTVIRHRGQPFPDPLARHATGSHHTGRSARQCANRHAALQTTKT